MQLVEVRKEEVLCDSILVARKFGQKHQEIVRRINQLVTELREVSNLPKMPIKEERIYRGKKYTAYLLSRDFFSLLIMRFKGKKALEWQIKFNAAFYEMEDYIRRDIINRGHDEWIIEREKGKVRRRGETDAIQEFVKYATKQGSSHAKWYYRNITNATYKALGLISHKHPKLRDTLSQMEIFHLGLAETIARRSLHKHMTDEIPYKKIYDFCKDDIMKFVQTLLIPKLEEKHYEVIEATKTETTHGL